MYKVFGRLGLSKCQKNDGKKKYGYWILLCKTNLMTESSAEQIPTVALRETEFDYQDESNQFSVFGYFGPRGFQREEPNALFGNQKTNSRLEKCRLRTLWARSSHEFWRTWGLILVKGLLFLVFSVLDVCDVKKRISKIDYWRTLYKCKSVK